jgi:hypothetical protein
MLNPFSVYNPFMNIYIYGNMLVKLLQTQKYYDPKMSSSNLYMFVCQYVCDFHRVVICRVGSRYLLA